MRPHLGKYRTEKCYLWQCVANSIYTFCGFCGCQISVCGWQSQTFGKNNHFLLAWLSSAKSQKYLKKFHFRQITQNGCTSRFVPLRCYRVRSPNKFFSKNRLTNANERDIIYKSLDNSTEQCWCSSVGRAADL